MSQGDLISLHPSNFNIKSPKRLLRSEVAIFFTRNEPTTIWSTGGTLTFFKIFENIFNMG